MGRGWLKVMDELQGTTELDNWANSAPSAPLQRGTSKGIFSYEWKEIRKKKKHFGCQEDNGDISASRRRCGAGKENISAWV